MQNKFKEFISLEDAIDFGRKYFSDWLKDFQTVGKMSRVFELCDLEYRRIKEAEGQECAERIKSECSIYKAFSYYCGGSQGLLINELCRTGYSSFLFDIDTIKSIIEMMDNEISRYTIKEDIVAYRTFSYGDLLKVQKRDRVDKGDIIADQGFMGASLVKVNLLKEHNYDTIIKIYVPVGCHAIYLDLISHRPNEQELLFKRGTRLKVLSNRTSFFNKKRNMVCVII